MFDYTGFGEQALTFACEETTVAGNPVTVSANDTVSPSADGESFVGVAATVRNSVATVIMGGFVCLPFSGSAPALGAAYLVADGQGGVKSAESGRSAMVINVDAEKGTVGFVF